MALLLTGASWSATAAFPDKPIKMVVPYPPGGQTATIAHVLGTKMGAVLGQPVVMESRPGAAGTIAAAAVAKAPKDGYTLLFANSSQLGAQKFVHKDLPYDPIADFAPVAYIGNVAVGVFASHKSGIDSLPKLLEVARANPGKISFSSPGVGGPSHLAAELFRARAGLNMLHVPYQSATPQMMDLASGQTDLAIGGAASGMNYVKDGRVKLVAIAGKSRAANYPGVQAVGEVFPGYDAPAWFGLVVPSGTPQDVVDKLAAAAQQALADPEIQPLLKTMDLEKETMSPQEFGQKIVREMPLWEAAVRAAGQLATPAR